MCIKMCATDIKPSRQRAPSLGDPDHTFPLLVPCPYSTLQLPSAPNSDRKAPCARTARGPRVSLGEAYLACAGAVAVGSPGTPAGAGGASARSRRRRWPPPAGQGGRRSAIPRRPPQAPGPGCERRGAKSPLRRRFSDRSAQYSTEKPRWKRANTHS